MGTMTRERRGWVYREGQEPDPRFSLANERTFLAWMRTSLAMIAGGVALDSVGISPHAWLRATLVIGLVVAGAALALLSLVRWARVERAMRLGEPLPAFGLGVVSTVAVLLCAVLLVMALV